MIISASTIHTGSTELSPGWIEIDGDVISGIGQGRTNAVDVEVPGFVVPGFVDIHCHGAGGFSFETEPDKAAMFLHQNGTTTVLASFVSDSIEALNTKIARVASSIHNGLIAGIHLEGPCLSPLKRGAHNPAFLYGPDVLDGIDDHGVVKMITLAPELPGAIEQIEKLRKRGIVIAIGHSDADSTQARAAFDAGATVVTHLFNAMRPINHRVAGIIEPALIDPRVTVEVIADGIHISDDVLALVQRTAPDRWVAVSDGSAGAGLDDFDFELGGLAAHVSGGVARLADGTLAGSAITMSQLFARLLKMMSLSEAVEATSSRPAKALGLSAGTLEVGRKADLVVWDEGIKRVMREGKWLDV